MTCPCTHPDAKHIERKFRVNNPPEWAIERKCTVSGCVCVNTTVVNLEKK